MARLLKNTVYQIIDTALKTFFEKNPQYHLTQRTQCLESIDIKLAQSEQFGHYQCNSAMCWGKIIGQQPHKLAQILLEIIHSESDTTLKQFESIQLAGPGFINFTFSEQQLFTQISVILDHPHMGLDPDILKSHAQVCVIVDFSSPNIAKQMHVGHLRTTLIGDALARLFEFFNYKVLRLNHVGDFGTSFGMLITWIQDTQPNFLNQDFSLDDLETFYKQSKQAFDQDPDFKQRSRAAVVRLQQNDPLIQQYWQKIYAISQIAFNQIYDLLDIRLTLRGESFYEPWLAETVQDLENKNLITLSDGAKCVFFENSAHKNRDGQDLPLLIQKQDTGYNYATTDLAAIRHRIQVEHAQKILYVTDAGQATHFQQCFETARRAGWTEKTQLIHVPFGMVLRADGKKFKTRAGNTLPLIDLLQEAIQAADHLLKVRHPNDPESERQKTAKILGLNAIKYSDLSCHRVSDYRFDPNKMVQFEGNTAAFLMYAFVRINGILLKINDSTESTRSIFQNFTGFKTPIEKTLAFKISLFPEILIQMLHELMPHRLTDYLYQLAELFQSFYHQCRVENDPEQAVRVILCRTTQQVLNTGFQLLGLKILDKM